jgi:hypothetical protein
MILDAHSGFPPPAKEPGAQTSARESHNHSDITTLLAIWLLDRAKP